MTHATPRHEHPDSGEQGWESLHYLVTHLAKAAFVREPAVITTNHNGRVDGGWERDPNGAMTPVPLRPWLEDADDDVRDFALRNLGGMLRLYASHPARNPLVSVVTYDEWPAMIEVHLSE